MICCSRGFLSSLKDVSGNLPKVSNPINFLENENLDYVELQFNENKDKLTKNDLKLNRNGKIKIF